MRERFRKYVAESGPEHADELCVSDTFMYLKTHRNVRIVSKDVVVRRRRRPLLLEGGNRGAAVGEVMLEFAAIAILVLFLTIDCRGQFRQSRRRHAADSKTRVWNVRES